MAKKASRKAKKPAAKKVVRKAIRRAAAKVKARVAKAVGPKWKMAGSQDVIVNLILRNAAGAIDFYKAAFGAEELMRHPSPDGKGIWHAELRVGDTVIAMNDEMPGGPVQMTAAGPGHPPTASFMLYTPDCDAMFNRAVQAGAKAAGPVMDMFWGDRMGTVTDPFGQVWMIATHKKDLSMEEMRKGGEQFAAQMAQTHGPGSSQPPPSATAH